MPSTILIGPYTYVLDNEDAARVAEQAAQAYRKKNYELCERLKLIASKIEKGSITAEQGLREAELGMVA